MNRPVLLTPSLNRASSPDATGGQLAYRLREALDPRDLIGPLASDAEDRGDLGDSNKFHPDALYPLTRSSARRTLSLDSVKREAEMVEARKKVWVQGTTGRIHTRRNCSAIGARYWPYQAEYTPEEIERAPKCKRCWR
jgi:hypothetical protein